MTDERDDIRNRSMFDSRRREFLKRVGMIGAGVALTDLILHSNDHPVAATPATENMQLQQEESLIAAQNSTGEIPRRQLGRTGVEVSAIGLGGFDLGKAKTYEEAERIVHEAIDAGITFMDNAWEYNNHRSEEWMGRALQKRREQVFLMTKVCTHGRDRKVAMQQLEESLRRLRTDRIDLWQIHEVVYYNDPEGNRIILHQGNG